MKTIANGKTRTMSKMTPSPLLPAIIITVARLPQRQGVHDREEGAKPVEGMTMAPLMACGARRSKAGAVGRMRGGLVAS